MIFLITRFGSLGDVILTTPVCENLKLKYPGCFIYYLTKKAYAPVLEENPYVDRIIIFEDRSFISLIFFIRKINPRRIYDLHSSLRSRILNLFFPGRVRRVRAYRREREKIIKGAPAVVPSAVDRYLDTISDDDIKIHTRKTGIFLSRSGENKARRLLEKIGVPPASEIIFVAPLAKWRNKEWNHFPEFFELAAKPGRFFLVAGDDYARAEKFLPENRYYRNFVKNISGKLSLRSLFAVLNASSCVISMDSGLAHAAAAFGKKSIVFFGPTVPAFGFAPQGAKIMEVSVPCRPCHLHGGGQCHRGDKVCMASITASDLMKEMEAML